MRPQNMLLWLKFDAHKVGVNSSSMDNMLIQYGNPQRLPKDRGIYRNWGAFFDFSDLLELPDPITIDEGLWSISVWLILPMTYETEQDHILI